ncbi:43049_t:CDS:2, partial [Gigaspora margarita]
MSTDNNLKLNSIENNEDEQKSENASLGYLRQLEEYLNELKITRFDCSQFNFDDLKVIGQGGFAIVYFIELQGVNYAVKRLKNNIYIDDDTFKRIKRE